MITYITVKRRRKAARLKKEAETIKSNIQNINDKKKQIAKEENDNEK